MRFVQPVEVRPQLLESSRRSRSAPGAALGPGGGPTPSRSCAPLQEEYRAWREGMPDSMSDSKTAVLLDEVCELDLDVLDVDLPRGFGRD